MKTAARSSEKNPISASAKNVASARPRRWPLKIADAYLLRHVMGATFRGLIWFGGLLLMATIIGAISRVANGSLSWAGFFNLVGSDIPRSLVFTLPMSLLYGTVQTFAELSSRGEAIALQVGGFSFSRMLRAPLLWSIFVGLCVFVLQERFVPSTQQAKQNILSQPKTKEVATKKNFQLWDSSDEKDGRKSLIQARTLDFKNGVMTRPRVQFFGTQGFRQIAANRGVWDESRRAWHFFSVTITTNDAPNNSNSQDNAPKIKFYAEQFFDLPSPSSMVKKTMTLAQHLDKGNLEMASISDLQAHRTVLQRQSSTQIAQKDFSAATRTRRLVNSMTYGIHDKIAAPFVCLFLVLIGAPLALRPQRTGGGFSMGISLIVLFSYYLLWTFAQDFGRGGEVNPILFGYLPLGVTALLGLILSAKKNR